jgi:hypothetical protein
MARSFLQSILAWFAGTAVALIMTSLIFKIGWQDKERVLIMGYGGLCSIVILYVKFTSQIKKKEMEIIEDKLKQKADVKDLEKFKCQIDVMHETLDYVAKNQEEAHATIDNIYNLLLRKQK